MSTFGAVLDARGQPLDQIRLLGVSAFGRHGALPAERTLGQRFVADLVVHLDTRDAAAQDDLAATVHYGELAEQVATVLGGEPVDLLETLAQRVAELALAHPSVRAVDVTVHKPAAPIAAAFDDVQVCIRRYRR